MSFRGNLRMPRKTPLETASSMRVPLKSDSISWKHWRPNARSFARNGTASALTSQAVENAKRSGKGLNKERKRCKACITRGFKICKIRSHKQRVNSKSLINWLKSEPRRTIH